MNAKAATVLIVEDSPIQTELLRRALEGAGYKVIAASNGAEGFAMAKANRPDAVVSDINMPVMDGYAMCHAIRGDAVLKHTPVVLLTMLSDPQDVIRGLNAGADAYVTKPYNIPTLVSRIESLLAYPPIPAPLVERRKVEVRLAGETHLIDAHGPRMLNLLVSTYENAVLQNRELIATQQALEDLNQHLEQKVLEKIAALRDSERRFRSLIEHASDLVAVVDAQGKIVYISPSVKRLVGYEADEVLGTLHLDYAHPEDRPAATAGLAELLRNPGKLYVSEFRFRAKDGTWVTLDSIARNALDDPPINGIVINSRDITERKHAEEKIAKLNRLYATLSEINMAIVHAASPAELFDRVCEVAVTHGRFKVAWIGTVDRADQMVTPVAHRGLAPEVMVKIRDSVGRITESRGRTATSIRENRTIYTNDYEVKRASTPWHAEAVKRGIRGSAALPIKQGGEIVGVLKLYVQERDFFDPEQLALLEEMRTDISFAMDGFDAEAKRTQAEAALLESEEKLRTISSSAQDAIVMMGNDGRIEFWNPSAERLFGYTADEATGKSLHDLIVPERLREKSKPGFEKFRVTGQGPIIGKTLELPSLRKDGTEFVAEHSISAVKLKGKWHAVGLVRDITERKLAEKEHGRQEERLTRSLEQTVVAVATTVEMRDPYTAGHQRRVADLATAIAAELRLPDEQIHGLHLAGIVHDLGKIHIPAEIMSKPGKLTDIEFSYIKTHPQAGYDILKDVEFPWPIAQIVLQHHERQDGTGYPQGLKGEAILLEARIMAVADVVEAMSSHRPYRPGLGIDKALAEIERGRGTAYDPAVADACLKLFREKGYAIPS